MAYCPHCNRRYDEDNATQPCCGTCGHPISCGCGGGHQHTRPTSQIPPSVADEVSEDGLSEDSGDSGEEDSGGASSFNPDDGLPF